jgi:hypothetical protein
MAEPEGGQGNPADTEPAAEEPSSLPQVVAVEAALRRWLSVMKMASAESTAVREAMTEASDHEMRGLDTLDPADLERDFAEVDRVLGQRLSEIVERWSAQTQEYRAIVAGIDDAVRGLVQRATLGGLSSADRAEAEEVFDGLVTIFAARRDQLVGSRRFADALRRERGRDAGVQASLIAVASLVDGAGEPEMLDQWERLIRTVPGRPQAPEALPHQERVDELSALDGLLSRWMLTLAARAASARTFRDVMHAAAVEAQSAAGRADRAGGQQRLAASLTPAAQEVQRVADEYAAIVAELDAGFRSLLSRDAAGGLSRWDRAEVDSVCRQMAGFARLARENRIDGWPLPQAQEGVLPEILALWTLIDDALKRVGEQQGKLDGWEQLVQARAKPGSTAGPVAAS